VDLSRPILYNYCEIDADVDVFQDTINQYPLIFSSVTELTAKATRHRASTSMYSLAFSVRVTTPPQYGRKGTASLQITSRTQQAHRFYRW